MQIYLKDENDKKKEAELEYSKWKIEQERKTLAEIKNIKQGYDEINACFQPSFTQGNIGIGAVGFQHGGIVSQPSIVGEKNYPEVVLPLNEPQRMSDILKGLGISSGGDKQVVQNFNITVNSQADVDMIMERASFKAKYL